MEENELIEKYLNFLAAAKTESESVTEAIRIAENAGFKEYAENTDYPAGSRIWKNVRGRSALFAVKGKKPMSEGVSILLAHVDSPRLDLKPNPLYAASDLVYFDTHYYGGIKKYQWVTIPLALHGRVAKKNGEIVKICIGEDETEPVLTVTDLPPHISGRQLQLKGSDVINGEGLNAVIGTADKSGKLPDSFLKLLKEKYDIDSDDLISSELSLVPAFKPKRVGFDGTLLGAYGQDDKVCAFTGLTALTEVEIPEYTALLILTDREETGSAGVTGVQSPYFRDFLEDLAEKEGCKIRKVLEKSLCFSGDVITTLDPNYPEEAEPRNMCHLGGGVVISKYRGSGGKADTQDATIEFLSLTHRLFSDNNILYQTGEAGKVDAGGGRTAGKFLSNYNIDTVDVGVPILSMHSPFEVTAVSDVVNAQSAYKVFFERKTAQ